MLVSPAITSILLPSQASTNSLSSSSSSNSSSASSASSHTSADTPTMDKPTPRKIRFAPLPDPRRSLLVTDDGEELPLPDFAELPASSYSNSQPSPMPTPTISLPLLPDTPPPSSFNPASLQKSGTWPKPRGLLRTFRRGTTPASSTDSLTPTPSVDEPVNLALQRWSSANSLTNGSPLSRTQSQSSVSSMAKRRGRGLLPSFGIGKERRSSSLSISQSNAKKNAGPPPPLPTNNPFANSVAPGGKRGTKMLNGRVYGSKQANPFASARDEEPAFVEWGYGGMGSVKNQEHAAWGRVTGSASASTSAASSTITVSSANSGPDVKAKGHVHGMGVVHTGGGEEDDDGSGMGWVKRRREAREREKLEKEAAERTQKEPEENANEEIKEKDGDGDGGGGEVGVGEAEVSTPMPATSPLGTPHACTPLGTPSLPFAAPSLGPSPLGTPSAHEEEHVLRAVTLPAHFRGHHHRSSSNGAVNILADAHAPPNSSSSSSGSSVSDDEDEEDEKKEEDEEEDDRRSKENDQDDDDDDEDEDEDEDAEAEQRRMTARSAGVEKISRHKE
ncbi:hypothetical protein FB45DRAFT_1037256 [Roridomyces roridus]|uniref:Uncharacterized protein n=1 Tax=Roridomyces roridus TaxID=1738132 RepID=A0AAD7B5S3_9AGAR|nr:hypothetical protein FB45DRAFT_1037256 [Roridomyces roridus]